MNPRFVEIARDPRLIPGVYEHCDQWCSYCPQTDRCLAHRCMTDYARSMGRDPAGTVFRSQQEVIEFTRDVAAAVGKATPELDAVLAGPPLEGPLATKDPLGDLALEYALGAGVVISQAGPRLPPTGPDSPRPTPLEVVLWLHLVIASRIYRAFASAAQAAAGQRDRMDDAHGCAKVALVAIGRSRKALLELSSVTDPRLIEDLVSRLDTLETGLEERFPHARAFIRPGLDVPVP
jgi:hypothetical protein